MIPLALTATVIAIVIVFLVVIFVALKGYVDKGIKKTCGMCDFCDTSLNHCWLRGISVGTEDEACVTFLNREECDATENSK